MPRYKVAYIREQGVGLVIMFVDSSFGTQSQQAQNNAVRVLEVRARSAGLAGNVVTVWNSGTGSMGFCAPPELNEVFQNTNLVSLVAKINKELYW